MNEKKNSHCRRGFNYSSYQMEKVRKLQINDKYEVENSPVIHF